MDAETKAKAETTRRRNAICNYIILLHEGGVWAAWKSMPKRKRTYAHELVEKLHWPLILAIQEAYLLPCKPNVHAWIGDYTHNCRGPIYGTHVNGRTGHIGDAYTERENEIEQLVFIYGYTVEEAEASCDHNGIY